MFKIYFTIIVLLAASANSYAGSKNSASVIVDPGRVYTFNELTKMALKNRPVFNSTAAVKLKSDHLHKAVRSAYGPTVVADAEFVVFNDKFNMPVVSDHPLNLPNIPSDITDGITDALQTLIKPLPVRDQYIFHAGVTLAQPLTRIYTIYHQDKALNDLSVKADIQKKVLERTVKYNVSLAAIAVLEAKEMVKVSRQAVSSLESVATLAENLVNAGTVGEYVALEAKASLSLGVAALKNAQNVLAVAASALARTVGSDTLTISNVKSLSDNLPPLPLSLNKSVEYGASHLPQLKIFTSVSASSKHRIKVIKSNMFPQISLVGHYDFRKNIYLVPENEFSAGLNATWELLSWGRRHHLAQAAKSDAVIAEFNREEAVAIAKSRVYTAWLQYDAVPGQLDALKDAVKAARSTYNIYKVRFDAGDGVITSLILAHNRLMQTESLKVQTLYAGWRKYLTLKMNLGDGYDPVLDK